MSWSRTIADVICQQVHILVADVSDCMPTSSHDIYVADVIDNNYVGAVLLIVTIYDTDNV